jgi:hypothetical protein
MLDSTLKNKINPIILIGGIAALLAGLIFRRNLSAEYFLFKSMGLFSNGPGSIPASVIEWFSLFKQSNLIGMLLLNIFDLVDYILLGLMYLSLYFLLKSKNQSLMLFSIILVFSGIFIYCCTNQAFAFLSLSNSYNLTNNTQEQMILISSGKMLLTTHYTFADYKNGFYPSFFLVTLGGLFCSISMLKSIYFNRFAAIMGIIGTSFGLTFYIFYYINKQLIIIPIAGSAPFLMVWYILIGIKLYKIKVNEIT